jgi:hypothetical protein
MIGPGEHDRRADIAAHRVDCDPRPTAQNCSPEDPVPVLRFVRPNFTPIIMAAFGAQIVRQLELAAIRAFLIVDRLQRMMAAAHVALRRRCFSFGDGHPGTCSIDWGS